MEKRKLASVQYVHHITPIEGADKIECVHVLGWQCVANKGQFHVGDHCVYMEVDSFLPVCEQFEFLSPVFFIKSELAKFGVIEKEVLKDGVKQVIEAPSFTNIILWVILTVLIALFGIRLFNKRKAEIAGFIGTNRILNTFVSFLAGFFTFSLAISLASELLVGIIIGAIGFIIIHLGLELAVLRDLKKFVRGLYKLPVGLVAVSLFVVSMNTGLFGFSERIPDEAKIKSVSVTIVGDSSQYGLFGEGDRWYSDNNFQYIPANNVLTGELTSLEDIMGYSTELLRQIVLISISLDT